MKKICMLLFMAAIYQCVYSQKVQEDQVPENVVKTFKQKFPTATHAKWEKEEDGQFECEFKQNKTEFSATFDSDGVWQETEEEIAVTALPAAVGASVEKEFGGYKIKEASKISDASGATTFEVDLANGKDKLEAMFDAQGKLISKKKEEKEG